MLQFLFYCCHVTVPLLVLPGEVHLETVIKDLRERFARIQLQVSPPLVAFRESVFLQSEAPDALVKPPKV